MEERLMKKRLCMAVVIVALGMGMSAAYAADYESATVTVLKKTLVAEDGQPIVYPKSDQPEVTAMVVELPVGGETGWHQHAYPLYAYVLAGSITVTLDTGAAQVFREGDAIIEVVNRPHNGVNTGNTPVKLVVFVTGVQGESITKQVKNPLSPDPVKQP